MIIGPEGIPLKCYFSDDQYAVISYVTKNGKVFGLCQHCNNEIPKETRDEWVVWKVSGD